MNQNTDNSLCIGTASRGDFVRLSGPARSAHVHIIGRTRMGKTTLLKSMIAQDLAAEPARGVAVFDPHGDLSTELSYFVPAHRASKFINFDPADRANPIGFNVIDAVEPDHRPLVAQQVLSGFLAIWGHELIGPRSSEILLMAVRLLMDARDVSLLCVPRVLTDGRYRARLYPSLEDPVVRHYWTSRFDLYDEEMQQQITAPILNKLSSLLAEPVFRNIIGQTKSTIHPRKIMDEGRVIVINLSKGILGEQPSYILGALMITAFTTAALSRANIPQHQRKPFYLYADEFQNYAGASFETILSESAKYGLALTVAHQYTAQLPKPVHAALFGNSSSMLAFRLGAEDAEFVGTHIGLKPIIDHRALGEAIETPTDQLTNLPRYSAVAAFEEDGVPIGPLHLDMLPEPPRLNSDEQRERLLRNSRVRFGRPRAAVEAKITRFLTAQPAAARRRSR